MENLSIFDFLPAEETKKYKPIKSDDWKWSFYDYPKEKNGLKVFSCFSCGGGSTMGYKLAGYAKFVLKRKLMLHGHGIRVREV